MKINKIKKFLKNLSKGTTPYLPEPKISFYDFKEFIDAFYDGKPIAYDINVIKLDDFSIFSTSWHKLMLERFVKLDLINYFLINNNDKNQHYHNIKVINNPNQAIPCDIDVIKRLNQSRILHTHEIKYLRANSQKKLKTSVYYDEDFNKVKFHFHDNGAQKIVFVFQPAWADQGKIHGSRGCIEDLDYSKIERQDHYQFYGLLTPNKEYNYIFIHDEYSFVHGWFHYNNGKEVHSTIKRFIEKVSCKYKKSILLGASKGGYGAYHIGKRIECIDKIILIAPIVDLEKYANEVNKTLLQQLDFDDSKIIQLKKIESVEPVCNASIVALTGGADYQVNEIKSNPFIQSEILDDVSEHTEIISTGYKEFISKHLFNC